MDDGVTASLIARSAAARIKAMRRLVPVQQRERFEAAAATYVEAATGLGRLLALRAVPAR